MTKPNIEFYRGRVSACNDLLREIPDMIDSAGYLYDEKILVAVKKRLAEYRDIEKDFLQRQIAKLEEENGKG